MIALPLLAAMVSGPMGGRAEATVFFGTYTSADGSKGILRSVLNLETGALAAPELAVETPNPSYLALHPSGRFLYAVNEASGGEVRAFALEAGNLRFLNSAQWAGGGPCHVSVHPGGKFLFAAAYGGGSVGVFPIGEDGSLAAASDTYQHAGSGPDKDRQEGPHMHFVLPSPDGAFVYACDLGTDDVLAFRFDASAGKLDRQPALGGRVPAGGGPRHLAFHPTAPFVYVNNEMALAATSFRRDPSTGALTAVKTVPTVAEGTPRRGNSTGAIRVDPSGRWLLVSNRGLDTIAVFRIGDDGDLERLGEVPAGVKTPRDFAFDPSGRWLVVAGQDGGGAVSFAFDPANGTLRPTGHGISMSRPVSVLFVP